MKYANYFRVLSEHIQSQSLKLGGAESVLDLRYESYIDLQGYDNEQIKADFNKLYSLMNGTPIREMDKIIYPICTLCRNHGPSENFV